MAPQRLPGTHLEKEIFLSPFFPALNAMDLSDSVMSVLSNAPRANHVNSV